MGRLKERSHESCQIVGIRWAVGIRRNTEAGDRTRRDPGEDQEYCGQSCGSVKASETARQVLPIDLPWIPGHEFSGVVEEIGTDAAPYSPGDAVFGATSGMGAYAEDTAVKAAVIAKKPSH